MKTITIKSTADIGKVDREVWESLQKYGQIDVTICEVGTPQKKRTLPQNAALHKYCTIIAEKMDSAGFTQRELIGKFKTGFDLPTTMHMIKDIFRAVALAMFQKESTKDLTTVEIQEVYRVVDQRFMEITGVGSPWPSNEPPLY